MITSVTPWTSTAQSDIDSSEPLSRLVVKEYTLQFYNAGDSIWMVAHWPNGGRIAFRLAFGINSNFEKVALNEVNGGILLTASTRLASYRVNIAFPEDDETVVHYTTTMRLRYPLLIPFWPRDVVPLTRKGKTENTAGTVHVHQVGTRSGLLYCSMTKPKNGSVFYFQNLSAMSPYCEASETSLAETVGGEWPEIGFQFPTNKDKPVPADQEYTISDAYVVLSEYIPEEAHDVAREYLQHLALAYTLIPRPETAYRDWLAIAAHALEDLQENKGCWTQTNGKPYLNAYVGDYKTPSEIMVQLAVLLPLHEYMQWSGEGSHLTGELRKGLSDFYDQNLRTIVRWHPSLEDELDKSEEQKREMVMDSWYLHHPLLNLSRLALSGDKDAERLFLDSIDFAIKVARHFSYEWPVFYKMTTLEVLKAETSPGKGGEKDVPGSYAHIMLMAWKLTKEKRFLNEAKRALKSLDGLAFDIFYQANNTVFGATALLELYRETGEERYLQISNCCLAGIFKNVQLWDCNYGNGKHVPNFFSIFPLNDAPYTAAYEEMEAFAALHHYLVLAEGIEILPSLKILIPEFIRYALNRLPFYYPPLLPQEMIASEIRTGEVQKDLWIPIEDLQDGWKESGQVGQEVYGAGLPFGIVPRHYIPLEAGIFLFVEYPISNLRKGNKKITFQTAGSTIFSCRLLLIGKTSAVMRVELKKGNFYETLEADATGHYRITCGTPIRISW